MYFILFSYLYATFDCDYPTFPADYLLTFKQNMLNQIQISFCLLQPNLHYLYTYHWLSYFDCLIITIKTDQ